MKSPVTISAELARQLILHLDRQREIKSGTWAQFRKDRMSYLADMEADELRHVEDMRRTLVEATTLAVVVDLKRKL